MSNHSKNKTIDLVLKLTADGRRMYEWDLEREYFISNKTFKNRTSAIRYDNNPEKVQQVLITSETEPGQYWHLDYNAAMNLFLKKTNAADALPSLCRFFFTETYKNTLSRSIVSHTKNGISATVMKEILDKLIAGESISVQKCPQLNKALWKEIQSVLWENYLPVCQLIPKNEKRRDNHPWILDTECLLKNTYFPDFLHHHKENSYSFLYSFLSEYFGGQYKEKLKCALKKYEKENNLSFPVDEFVESVIKRLNKGEVILLYDLPGSAAVSLSAEYAISKKTISKIKTIIIQGENSYPISASEQKVFWIRPQNAEANQSVSSDSLFQKSKKQSVRCALILISLQLSEKQTLSKNDLFELVKEYFIGDSVIENNQKVYSSQIRTFQKCLRKLIKEGFITRVDSSSPTSYTVTKKSPILLQKSYDETLAITQYMRLFQNNPMTPNSLNKIYNYLNLFISVVDSECEDEFNQDRPMSIHLGKQPADSREYQKVKKLFHDVDYCNFAVKIGTPFLNNPEKMHYDIVFSVSLYYTDEKNQFYLLGIINKKNWEKSPTYTLIPVNRIQSVEVCEEIKNTAFHNLTYMKTYEQILSAGEPNSPETKIVLRFPGLNKEPANEEERLQKERTNQKLQTLYRSRLRPVEDDSKSPKSKTEKENCAFPQIRNSGEDLIYEDMVKDLSECNYYIRKFFDQCIIEEPDELKKIQKKSAEKLLNRYGVEVTNIGYKK